MTMFLQAAVDLRGPQQPLAPNLVEEEFGPCSSPEGMTLSKILGGADYTGMEYRLTFLESTYTSVAWRCYNADIVGDDNWAEEIKNVAEYDDLCTSPSTAVIADYQHGDYTWGASTEPEYACVINLVATGSELPPEKAIFDTTFFFTTLADGFEFRAQMSILPIPSPMYVFSYAPTYTFVGNCITTGRVWNQMFADGYGTDCGSGRTGDACAQVCADDCARIGSCIGYYYGDQKNLYGENALGQCAWFFDSVEACNSNSEANPYSSQGHPAYGTWTQMSNLFCGQESARSGPWVQADDDACASTPRVGANYFYSSYKKTGRGYGNEN